MFLGYFSHAGLLALDIILALLFLFLLVRSSVCVNDIHGLIGLENWPKKFCFYPMVLHYFFQKVFSFDVARHLGF